MRRAAAVSASAAAVLLLLALGTWQLERRAWKHALIERVEQRLAAPPAAAPGPDLWPRLGPGDAYARVVARGRWRRGNDTLVQAVTRFGPGHWVLTPLDTDAGWPLMVNRGFVPADARADLPPAPAGPVVVAGLLRFSEPGGAFLRVNDPDGDHWYSRDVAAITARRGVAGAAPYFVDADRQGQGWPRGGLTVVRFADNHAVYALTWFALAGLITFLTARALRRGRPRRWGRWWVRRLPHSRSKRDS